MRTTLYRLGVLLVAVTAVFAARAQANQVGDREALHAQRLAEVAALREANAEAEQRNRLLHDEVLALHDEPASVERRARDEHALVYPDEVVLVFEADAPHGSTSTGTAELVARQIAAASR